MDGINSLYGSSNLYSSLVNYSMMTNSTQTLDGMLSQDSSSIYNQYVDTDYMETFKSKLSSLESSSASLVTSETDSVFDERTASSFDTSLLTAQAEAGATKTDYNIDISQIAQTQRNESSSFDSDADAENNFQTGDNTFKITQNGTEDQITVNIDTSDTNIDVLNKMESKINNSDLNVKADVVNNGDGTSNLEVESTKTGADYSFSISDVDKDLVASSGISNTTRTAQDANYSVDGSSYTSTDNEVTVDNGAVTLDLKSAGSAEVTVASDTEAITDDIKSFVEDYNDAVSFLKSEPMNENATDLANQIADITQDNEWELENVGISVASNGELSVNEDKLTEALNEDPGQVKDVLGDVSGVATEIHNKAEDTLTNPLSKYSELQNYSLYNTDGQTSYFQSNMPGMLFDFYL